MADLYLWLLIIVCFLLLGWGLIRLERIYQYPFFMGGIFSTFILPQAIALSNNPGPVSQQALERVLLMSILCAVMCWLGYQLPLSHKLIAKLGVSINSKKLLQGGIVFVLVGYICNYLISQLPEEIIQSSQWSGTITIYAFFRSLIYPGFAIILMSTLKRPTVTKLVLTSCAAAIPIQLAVFYGRREPTATFILTVGLCLYFLRRYLPPRWLVFSVLIFTLVAIPLIGSYRSIATSGNWSQLSELRPVGELQSLIEEGKILELRNAALEMDAAIRTRQYAYGTDYWNNLIFRFVPAQIVGREIKEALQIKLSNYNLQTQYNYSIPSGSTTTGIGDAFVQFDYLGCIFFLILASAFKHLWVAAVYKNNIASQVFYISLIGPAMLSVTHGTIRFLPDFLFRLIFIGIVFIYAWKNTIKSEVAEISSK